MPKFTSYTVDTAPAASKPALEAARSAFGMVPNLQTYMAEAPALLNAYMQLWDIFHKQTSLTPVEQQVVLLTASYENNCEYCMSGHSFLAQKAGMSSGDLEAIRMGGTMPDPRLEALHAFTGAVVRERGWLDESDIAAFLRAGYSKAQLLEVIAGVSLKVMSNYTNHVTHTPLDGFMAATTWTKPMAANR